MITITITVPGQPIAQPRQTHRIVWPSLMDFVALTKTTSGYGGLLKKLRSSIFTQNFVPKTHDVHGYKQAIKLAALSQFSGDLLTCPVWMSVKFIFARPQAMIWIRKPMPRAIHARLPDRDNLVKAVQDALEKVIYWNDSQVCAGPIEKWYAAGDEGPHTEIVIKPIRG